MSSGQTRACTSILVQKTAGGPITAVLSITEYLVFQHSCSINAIQNQLFCGKLKKSQPLDVLIKHNCTKSKEVFNK